MGPEIAKPLQSLSAEARIVIETRHLVTLAHGANRLPHGQPGNGPVLRISKLVTGIPRCAPEPKDTPGDFAKPAERTPQGVEASAKLKTVVDPIRRAAAFQNEPVRAALVDLVSRLPEPRELVV